MLTSALDASVPARSPVPSDFLNQTETNKLPRTNLGTGILFSIFTSKPIYDKLEFNQGVNLMAQAQRKLLITGFDPFGGQHINPSWEAVNALPDCIGAFSLTKLQIPTVYELAAQTVLEKANRLLPSAIICVGQAAGRNAVTPELVGINLRYSNLADNSGVIYKDAPIASDGPSAYFSTLPVRAMADAISVKNIPAGVSYSAGTFVCNDVLYTLLHHYTRTDTKVCFIHVPFLPEQALHGEPSMPLETICDALCTAIESIEI